MWVIRKDMVKGKMNTYIVERDEYNHRKNSYEKVKFSIKADFVTAVEGVVCFYRDIKAKKSDYPMRELIYVLPVTAASSIHLEGVELKKVK